MKIKKNFFTQTKIFLFMYIDIAIVIWNSY